MGYLVPSGAPARNTTAIPPAPVRASRRYPASTAPGVSPASQPDRDSPATRTSCPGRHAASRLWQFHRKAIAKEYLGKLREFIYSNA